MGKQWRGFFVGFLSAILVFCLGTPAFASTVRQLEASYSGIRIILDGVEVTPEDVNGNPVEPFAVKGTTYLPVRAVAEALGGVLGRCNADRSAYKKRNGPGTAELWKQYRVLWLYKWNVLRHICDRFKMD